MTEEELIRRACVDAVERLYLNYEEAAAAIASDFNLDHDATRLMLTNMVLERFYAPPVRAMDSRTARWRCRFRIYDARQMDEPVADSDDELPPGAPGSMVIAGLPNVGTEAIALAQAFHKSGQLSGLNSQMLDKSLKGLRPTISRRGGNAVWRLPYDTIDTYNEHSLKRGWLMRVDIIREETEK